MTSVLREVRADCYGNLEENRLFFLGNPSEVGATNLLRASEGLIRALDTESPSLRFHTSDNRKPEEVSSFIPGTACGTGDPRPYLSEPVGRLVACTLMASPDDSAMRCL